MTFEVVVVVDRNLPLYIQIADRVESYILNGLWSPGTRVIPERSLAQHLGVSRNTVSQAYHELARRGLIYKQRGKGTFVERKERIAKRGKVERLAGMVDNLIDEARGLGVSGEELLTLVERHVLASDQPEVYRLAFVECNREQVDFFARTLEKEFAMPVAPIVLEEMETKPARTARLLGGAEVVITTFFHLNQVEDILRGQNKKILSIALEPAYETIVELARVQGPKCGLICISDRFASKVRDSIRKAGIRLAVDHTTLRDTASLKDKFATYPVLLVSPGRRADVEAVFPEKKIIEFVYRPDTASLNLLTRVIGEMS